MPSICWRELHALRKRFFSLDPTTERVDTPRALAGSWSGSPDWGIGRHGQEQSPRIVESVSCSAGPPAEVGISTQSTPRPMAGIRWKKLAKNHYWAACSNWAFAGGSPQPQFSFRNHSPTGLSYSTKVGLQGNPTGLVTLPFWMSLFPQATAKRRFHAWISLISQLDWLFLVLVLAAQTKHSVSKLNCFAVQKSLDSELCICAKSCSITFLFIIFRSTWSYRFCVLEMLLNTSRESNPEKQTITLWVFSTKDFTFF